MLVMDVEMVQYAALLMRQISFPTALLSFLLQRIVFVGEDGGGVKLATGETSYQLVEQSPFRMSLFRVQWWEVKSPTTTTSEVIATSPQGCNKGALIELQDSIFIFNHEYRRKGTLLITPTLHGFQVTSLSLSLQISMDTGTFEGFK